MESESAVIAVEIRGEGFNYEAFVATGFLDQVGSTIEEKISRRRCAIISDANVAPLFAERAEQSLKRAGFDPILITIPAGEQSKTLEQAGAVCDEMIAAGVERPSCIIL